MKIIEEVLDSVIRSQVDIDSMQFGFMPGWDTTDAIFILCQLKEKHLVKHNPVFCSYWLRRNRFWLCRSFSGGLWGELELRNGWYLQLLRQCMKMLNPVYIWMVNSVISLRSSWYSEFSTLHNSYGSLIKEIQSLLSQRNADYLVLMAETEDLKKKLTSWKDVIEAKRLCVSFNELKLVL